MVKIKASFPAQPVMAGCLFFICLRPRPSKCIRRLQTFRPTTVRRLQMRFHGDQGSPYRDANDSENSCWCWIFCPRILVRMWLLIPFFLAPVHMFAARNITHSCFSNANEWQNWWDITVACPTPASPASATGELRRARHFGWFEPRGAKGHGSLRQCHGHRIRLNSSQNSWINTE